MQRSSCFGETDHTIPIILLRAMLHLFFFSGMLCCNFYCPRMCKDTTNGLRPLSRC